MPSITPQFGIGILMSALFAFYLTWQALLRNQMLWNSKSEPPMLPYLIPGIGHSFAFLRDTHQTLVNSRTYFGPMARPFSCLIGGKRTYIIMNPRDIAETYKKTAELNFDAYIEQVMGLVGVHDRTVKLMWSTIVPSTNLLVPNAIRYWVRENFKKGPKSDTFYAHFLSVLDNTLRDGQVVEVVTSSAGLLKWTGDIIISASTNAMFGPVCLTHAPELLGSFQEFNHRAWMILFQYPKLLARVAHRGMSTSIEALTKYFDLPQDKRSDAADFITKSEDEMRKIGINSKDIAAVLFKLYWAINGNPSILAFWLLGHILYDTALLKDIRAEIIPAFKNGIHCQPELSFLLEHCPKLNAAFYETMRVHGGASTFRRVVTDTTVAGYEFKANCDVMLPYRQLHMNDAYWGMGAEKFDVEKFVREPKLAASRVFKPFGGGATLCPGRFLAQQTAVTFIATLLARFDIVVIGGISSQKFPAMDDCKPTLGIISPIMADDIKISVKAVI